MKEKSISEKYFSLLMESDTPITVLVKFLQEVFQITPTDFVYSFIGKLVKLYGREVVFLALLTLVSSDMDFSDFQRFKNYLAVVCRNLFAEKFKSSQPLYDLTSKARRLHRRFYGKH